MVRPKGYSEIRYPNSLLLPFPSNEIELDLDEQLSLQRNPDADSLSGCGSTLHKFVPFIRKQHIDLHDIRSTDPLPPFLLSFLPKQRIPYSPNNLNIPLFNIPNRNM